MCAHSVCWADYPQPLIRLFQQTKTEELLKPAGYLLIYKLRFLSVRFAVHPPWVHLLPRCCCLQSAAWCSCLQPVLLPRGASTWSPWSTSSPCSSLRWEPQTHNTTDAYSCCKVFYCLVLYSCGRLKHPLVNYVTPGWEDFTIGYFDSRDISVTVLGDFVWFVSLKCFVFRFSL